MNHLQAILLTCVATGMFAMEGPLQPITFTADATGTASNQVPPLIGLWSVMADGDRHVLQVDGAHWQRDRVPTGLDATVATLFGTQGPALAERIRTTPTQYPLAVITPVADFTGGTIAIRFKPIAGTEDQGAGIAFGISAEGEYTVVRANALESNLMLARIAIGKRTKLLTVDGAPAATGQWHSLSVTITGREVVASLNGAEKLRHTLPEPVRGRIGLWTKADSVMWYDDIRVTTSP